MAICVAHGAQADTTRMRYAYASYLLVVAPGVFFSYAAHPYAQVWLYAEYELKLGAPRSPRRREGALWVRDFEGGKVTVDNLAAVGTLATWAPVTAG